MLLNYTYKDANNLVVPEKGLYLMQTVNSIFISPSCIPLRRPAGPSNHSVVRHKWLKRPIGPLYPLVAPIIPRFALMRAPHPPHPRRKVYAGGYPLRKWLICIHFSSSHRVKINVAVQHAARTMPTINNVNEINELAWTVGDQR